MRLNKNGNKLPTRFPLIYLPFHHQFLKEKESSEKNELKIFKITKNGLKAMSELAKKSQSKTRPLSAFKYSESSLVNLQPVYKKMFSEDVPIKTQDNETTKVDTSWKNRSKTYRFDDHDVKSEVAEIKYRMSRRASMEVQRSKCRLVTFYTSVSSNYCLKEPSPSKRPKTAKKFETMHYLSPTKSSLALAPEEVHLHPTVEPRSIRRLQRFRPGSMSLKNMKTSLNNKKIIKSNSKKRMRRRMSIKEFR